jgi:hypothetical protein
MAHRPQQRRMRVAFEHVPDADEVPHMAGSSLGETKKP